MRLLVSLLAVLGLAPAHLGSGDDVVPRDTVSTVDSVVPALPAGVLVDVVGGDTFLRVRSRGHAVEISGYDDEPYIRIDRSGTVEENKSSRSSLMNGSRLGSPDDEFDPAAAPRWVTLSRNGTVLWHDHRIHWMGSGPPATVDAKGTVQNWTLPVVVDGTAHTVSGTLVLKNRAGVSWWSAVLISALASASLLRGPRRRWLALVTWVSALSCFVGFLEWRALPSGAQITPLMLLFGAGALVVSNTAMVLQKEADANPKKRIRNELIAGSLSAGAGVTLVIAGLLSSGQLRAAYFPFDGPLWIARATVAGMLGVGFAAAVDGVMRVMKVEPRPN